MNLLKLSFRMLCRDGRAGELHVLILALVIAVASMTTVGYFADRVEKTLAQESNQLLGADLLITSSREISSDYADEAQRLGMKTAWVTKFPSMIFNGEKSLLVEIKAVTAGYPLRGELMLSNIFSDQITQANSRVAQSIPEPGTLWVDQKVMIRLDLQQGDKIELGAITLTVTTVIAKEPDYSVGFINLRPRVLVNAADLPASELIQEGSRIKYNMLVAGEVPIVEQFRDWSKSKLSTSERLESIRDARPEIRSALNRSEKFLSLVALTSVVLAAAAVSLAVRRFTRRHLDGCAVMKSLGASQKNVLDLYLYYFIMLGLIGSMLGCALGFAAQEILASWLADLVETTLAPPGWQPAIQGLLVGMVLLLGFSLPPILNLRSIPALRVLRRDIGLSNTQSITGYLFGLVALSLLFLWEASDLRLGLYIIGGFVVALIVFGLTGWLLIKLLSRMRKSTGSAWRYGLASIHRRAISSIVQAAALGLGLMSLLVLVLVKDDLLSDWTASLPPDAPNNFLINIQPDQQLGLEAFFNKHDIMPPQLFPMVRGRLTEINDKKVTSEEFLNPRAERLIRREFNLSWASELQEDNQIVEGSWWEKPSEEAELSLEAGIARALGVTIGDTLTYDIAGSLFKARVTSFRHVNWDSFRVNFFVLTPPEFLDAYPASYITGFYVPPEKEAVMHDLVREFPNFLVIDVASVINQVQKMIAQVSSAIEFVFLFTLLAGFVVLYSAIVSTQDERIYEAAIFRTLGSKRAQLTKTWAAEFAILGGLAGSFAALGASILGYVVGHHLLHLSYSFNPWIWMVGIVAGVVSVTIAGLMGTRTVLLKPPLTTLRHIE